MAKGKKQQETDWLKNEQEKFDLLNKAYQELVDTRKKLNEIEATITSPYREPRHDLGWIDGLTAEEARNALRTVLVKVSENGYEAMESEYLLRNDRQMLAESGNHHLSFNVGQAEHVAHWLAELIRQMETEIMVARRDHESCTNCGPEE
jgi:chemotaxis protein histidine kinase CheA